MDGQIRLACRVLTVVHARWVAAPGKYRRAIPKIAKVRWDDARSCRIYLPAAVREEHLDGWVGELSDYARAPLQRISAETLPFVCTRPDALASVPPGCVPVELGKWDTGIGLPTPGELLTEEDVDDARK